LIVKSGSLLVFSGAVSCYPLVSFHPQKSG
jgi:hypothetical protein